jgi:glycerol kinase
MAAAGHAGLEPRSMGDPLYLAVDQGGHASRALVFDAAGHTRTLAFAAVGTIRNALGHVEHDAEELLGATRRVIDDAVQNLGGRAAEVAAAGLVTQRSTLVCWDRTSGAALAPAISWQDRRNAAWLAKFAPRADWIKAKTGLVLSPHYGASKLRWCLDHLPAVKRAAAAGRLAAGPLSSFLAFGLLDGSPLIADPANASRTLLYDPQALDWSPDLLELFDIPRAILPECRPSLGRFGALTAAGQSIPLTVITGDQSAVPFAWGAPSPDCVFVNVGTGAFVQRTVRDRLPAASGLLSSVALYDGRSVTLAHEGTINGAGSALDWLAERAGIDTARMLESLDDTDLARAQPPLFLNGVSGLAAPFWVSDFESRFLGPGSELEKFLAVLESIAFLIRVNIDEMRRTPPAISRIVLTGGFGRSVRFCQWLADLVELQVLRAGEQEASARGVACLSAGLPSAWQDEGGEVFRPARNPALLARYVAWLRALRASLATR